MAFFLDICFEFDEEYCKTMKYLKKLTPNKAFFALLEFCDNKNMHSYIYIFDVFYYRKYAYLLPELLIFCVDHTYRRSTAQCIALQNDQSIVCLK